ERLHAAGLGAFFRPSQLSEAGLTPDQLPSLVRRRVVEHVTRGLYRLLDAESTENYSLAMACARVPNSIVCLLSALRVHGIGSQAPAHVWLGIPHKARPPRLRARGRCGIRANARARRCGPPAQARSASTAGTWRRRRRFRTSHCCCGASFSRKLTSPAARSAIGTPSRYRRRLPLREGSRAPGVRMPTRLSGSAPESEA